MFTVSAAAENKMNPLLDNYLSSGLEIIRRYVRTSHIQHVHHYSFIHPASIY